MHEDDHNCKADWSFFATAHGKGPIDGIGGEVKRQVWRSELQGKTVVHNAKSFADVASQLCPKVCVIYKSGYEIEEMTSHLQPRYDSCRLLPGTQSCHFVKPVNKQVLAFGPNAIFSNPSAPLSVCALLRVNEGIHEGEVNAPEQPSDDDSAPAGSVSSTSEESPMPMIKCGDFIRACLEGRRKTNYFVGQVLQMSDSALEVNFLRAANSSQKTFVYPATEDKAHIDLNEVAEVLPVPTMDARGRYIFPFTVNVTQ